MKGETLLFLLLVALTIPTHTNAQGRTFSSEPFDNARLYQAVALWTGSDHNRAEITGLYGHISEWDVSRVTTFNSLFKGATTFDEDLSLWNTTSVTDMADVFNGCTSMRGKPSLENWQASKVQTMARMFKSATSWEGDLSSFDTSSVTDMSNMFQGATLFKGEGLNTWDVKSVESFNYMFNRATNFNEDVSKWKLESAEYMEGMFEYAVSFDQDLSSWNMENVQSVASMFEGAAAFDQSVCWPDLSQNAVVADMFCESHPGAHLDPCCAASDTLIVDACCGGSCDTFCTPENLDTRPPVSNDPGAPNEDDSLLDEDPTGDDTVIVDMTVAPNEVASNVTNNNSTVAPTLDLGTTVVSVESGQSEEDTKEEGNIWQRNVWFRILIYVLAVILLGVLFLYFLHCRTKRRRAVPADEDEDGVTAADTKEEKDEEVGVVETKPTDETDAVEVKAMDGSGNNNKETETKDTAPPESPKK